MQEPALTISELPRELIPAAVELLAFLNPDSTRETIAKRLDTILSDHGHYQLWGAFVDGNLRGLAGTWIGTKIWCGKYLEIDNLVIHPECRSSGVGSTLIRHLEQVARDRNCSVLTLDSYTTNRASHRLYHKLGFEIWGFHFIREVGDFTGESRA